MTIVAAARAFGSGPASPLRGDQGGASSDLRRFAAVPFADSRRLAASRLGASSAWAYYNRKATSLTSKNAGFSRLGFLGRRTTSAGQGRGAQPIATALPRLRRGRGAGRPPLLERRKFENDHFT